MKGYKRKSGKKLATTIYLDPCQIESLKSVRRDDRVPVAALIREAIDEYVSRVKTENNRLDELEAETKRLWEAVRQ